MDEQCRVDRSGNCLAISSSTQPNWWDHDNHLHSAAAAGVGSHVSASPWPWHRQQQPNPNSNSSCDDDVSMSSTSFTNTSNHSSLSVDSSRRRVDQLSASSNDNLNNIGEQVSDNQVWSQVLLSVRNNGLNNSMAHDVGENFLETLSSKNLSSSAMYEPACDYLKKLDNANNNNNNWEFTNSSPAAAAAMHASNVSNFERQININGSFSNNNLSNLVSTSWSIAPPEPQVVNSPYFSLPQMSSYGAAHNNLMEIENTAQLAGANLHGNNNNIEYQIGLNNTMDADNNYYGSGHGLLMPGHDSYSSSNSARNFKDVISFGSRLGKPTIDHIHHAQKPISNFKSLINSSDSASKKQGFQTNSIPTRASGRGQGSASESGKKKRTEETTTSSETVTKKPKQETSSANSSPVKMQAPKVKVTEKVTALQQIVSPFGKTDTASVLYEAVQYIKFLQDQVHVLLSNPYSKTTNCHKQDPWGRFDQMKGDHHTKVDLKSRGLCLVPTSCTPQVYRENTGSDYWTPTYRGCLYR